VKLPTIGRKSAERLAFFLLQAEKPQVLRLADVIRDMKNSIRLCKECFNVAEGELCTFCSDPARDKSTVCVVESPIEVISFERSGTYHGLYHVLHGRLSPLAGVTPEDLKIDDLIERVKDGDIKEVIIATNPDVEGDATAIYISKLLGETDVAVTRIGLGLPMGGSLEYADEITLGKAIEGRKKLIHNKEKKS
jgi:recombination protein RecR